MERSGEWGEGRDKQRAERNENGWGGGRLAAENGPTPLQAAILIGFIDNPYLPYFYYARELLLGKILKIIKTIVISKDKKIYILGKIEFFVLPNKVRGKVLIEEHLGISNMQLMQIMRCYYYYFFFPFP